MKILLPFLIYIFITEINVWEPQQLATLYKDKLPEYVLANFGIYPYGSNLFGTIHRAVPFDGCGPLDPIKSEKNESIIILFTRGNCHFAEKVLNAQNIGAVWVIIGDSLDEKVHSIYPIEKSKELKNKIKIPSLILSSKDFVNFTNSMNNNKQNIELYINFKLKKSHEKSTIKLFLEIEDYKTLDIINSWKYYHKKFGKNMEINIIYNLDTNFIIDSMTPEFLSCYDKDYCVSWTNTNYLNKKDKIEETIKQMCLYSFEDYNLYSDYLNYYLIYSFENYNDEKVLKKNFKIKMDNYFEKLKVNKKVIECIKNPKIGFSLYSEEEKNLRISYTPLIYINGYLIKSTLNINNIIDAFCNSFVKSLKYCNEFNKYPNISEYTTKEFIFLTYIISVAAIIVSFLIFYCIFKIIVKREMSNKLNHRINEALNKYYKKDNELKEENNIKDDKIILEEK